MFMSTRRLFHPLISSSMVEVHPCIPRDGDLHSRAFNDFQPSGARDPYLCVLYSVECGPERPEKCETLFFSPKQLVN